MYSNKTLLIVALVTILGVVILSYVDHLSPVLTFVIGVVATFIIFSLFGKSSGDQSSSSQLGTTTLYVGNLPYKANESHVKTLFSEYGEVFAVRLMKDKKTGKRRGFGFVVMSELDAPKTIDALNEYNYMDRTLKVRIANDPKSTDKENNL
ncbi:RNA recognition motif domain-containing protein [Vibrio salinus]|uniref:RNA recognition motif domain-containing protein n=1 Tax=Vibrio salinus TaxID=2899784 RepID=UPI001E3A62F2|nr:RNA-binding protein [Vibrio salinus]MCE0493517.1 RNA-binding protein [Vibrio salinus]